MQLILFLHVLSEVKDIGILLLPNMFIIGSPGTNPDIIILSLSRIDL